MRFTCRATVTADDGRRFLLEHHQNYPDTPATDTVTVEDAGEQRKAAFVSSECVGDTVKFYFIDGMAAHASLVVVIINTERSEAHAGVWTAACATLEGLARTAKAISAMDAALLNHLYFIAFED